MHRDNLQAVSASGLLAADDVWPAMQNYAIDGQRTALVTLVGVDGVAPREVGAQLAVAEDGRHFGYLSGGCIEKSIARQAVEQIRSGQNLLERYGRGSKYFDIRLPCGSGLDLYFDCSIGRDDITKIRMFQDRRQPFVIRSDLASGTSARSHIAEVAGPLLPGRPQRDGQTFSRLHIPNLQLFVIGNGPAASGIARIGHSAGFAVKVWTNDGEVQEDLASHHIEAHSAASRAAALISSADVFTAVVFAFHDHDIEIPMIMTALSGHSFYLGALGSRAVHAQRLDTLRKRGAHDEHLAHLRPTIGLIPGAKSKATLALGVISDILAEAKQRGFVS